jgi:hypothetical protein
VRRYARLPDQSDITTKEPAIDPICAFARAGRLMEGKSFSGHTGPAKSGIGVARKSFLHWCAVHRAHLFDFLRRALSVEMPVFAYICR